MRLIISTLIHGRHATVRRCNALNRNAGINYYTCAYSDDSDKQVAKDISNVSTKADNIIPIKAQASLNLTRQVKHDAVMLMGCDDYINLKTHLHIKSLLVNHDYIAFKNIYFEQDGEFWLWPGYPGEYRKDEPAGAGKVVRADLLAEIDYQVFSDKDHFTDVDSHAKLMAHAKNPIFVDVVEDDLLMVDVKDGNSRTPLSRFKYLVKTNLEVSS